MSRTMQAVSQDELGGAEVRELVGAWRALVEIGDVGRGSRVLINDAADGVGRVAVQITKARGAHVIALATPANADFVRSLGADEVIDYAATDFTEVVGDLDVVLDVVGGAYPAKALEVLKPGGTLVSILPPTLIPVAKDAADRGIRLAGLLVEADRPGLSAPADLTAAGKLVPTIVTTIPFDEAAAAQSANACSGMVVLRFPKG